jgi:DNA end-binding protein Ku
MAARAFWKGYLKLALVTCRVAMTPATSAAEKLRFHTVNEKTGNRVESRYVDARTGRPVDEKEEVRGYPISEDEHVLIEDEELEAVSLESTRTIDIDCFVPRDSIGWIWYDKPHYLVPDDEIAEEAFCVIRDTMAATDLVGLSRVVLYRRERALMLEPRGKGIVAWTLRYGDEVREAEEYFSEIDERKPDAKRLRLVTRLIEEKTADWDPSMVEDPVQDRLKEIIESRKRKKKKSSKPAGKKGKQAPPDNVVSIMDALRKSVKEKSRKGKGR